MFRVVRGSDLWNEILAIGELAGDLEKRASIHVRVAGSNPAQRWADDRSNANWIAEALAAALTQENVKVFIDTFADVERGFFMRNGVTDRRYNPRLGSHVARHLYAALNRDHAPLHAHAACRADVR